MDRDAALALFLTYGSLADALAGALSERYIREGTYLTPEQKDALKQVTREEVEHARIQRDLALKYGAEGVSPAYGGPYTTFWRELTLSCDLPLAMACGTVVEAISAFQFRTLGLRVQTWDKTTGRILQDIARDEYRHVLLGIERLRGGHYGDINTIIRAGAMTDAIVKADPSFIPIALALGVQPRVAGVRVAQEIARRVVG